MKKFFTKQRAALALAAVMAVSIIGGMFAASGSPTFSDVPTTHWAYSYVERAADNGWVNGVGNGKFGVDQQVTYGELALMLGRSIYPELIDWYGGDPEEVAWYVPCLAVMAGMGLDNGTPLDNNLEGAALQPINRYNMAQILFNFLKDGSKVPSYDAAAVQAGIGDWSSVPSNYQEALMAVVSADIITGVDSKGTFNGNGYMTRGQAAVVLCRMYDVFSGTGVTTPTDPTEPTNPTTPADPDDPFAPAGGYGQKLSSGATAAAGVKTTIGKDDAYPTYGNSDVVSNNGYFTGATDADIGTAQLQYAFLDMVNEARVAEGHEPLTWGDRDSMEEYTLIRATELVSNFSHDRAKGIFSGEVIAKGQQSVTQAFNEWMNSPGHKRTLMSDTYSYLTAARAQNCWIICVWEKFGVQNADKWSANNYDMSSVIDGV